MGVPHCVVTRTQLSLKGTFGSEFTGRSCLDIHTVFGEPGSYEPVPAPRYLTGYYFSSDAKPTKSELQIMNTFEKDSRFPKHVQDISKQLMDKEQSRVPHDQVQAWYKEQFDAPIHSAAQHAPRSINIHHLVRYRQETGICLRIAQAFGLDVDGLYINAFARILKGTSSMHLPELPQRWGGDEKFLTRRHDFSSLLKSPRWTDPSVVLHPYLDEHSVLLIQLFGIDAVYIPDPRGQRVGVVTSRSGQDVELYSQTQLGWTAVPLFDRQYVNSGIHSAPLFQGVPNTDFQESITSHPLKDVMIDGLKKETLKLMKNYGSITIEIWDGHYLDDEHYKLPVVNDLLTVNKLKKFLTTQSNKKGKDMSLLVLQSLNKKQPKLKRNSPEYQQLERFYEEAMANKFYILVESALLNAGFGPL
uniref:Uncharacterized protein LOC117349254 n=1 Tax=Geotrypetes seraphini TaxID=260995 RepID=A0A6P8PUC5_GEOSA|nr:uncharacterized protein LOC117349254 [Geotrypetes seraphini]